MNLDNHNEIVGALRRSHDELLTTTRRVHLHLGVVTGLGMALDEIRKHLPTSHPVRKAVFAKLMEVNEGNVHDIVSKRNFNPEGNDP